MILALTGPNGFLLRSKLRSITSEFIEKYGNFGLERISAAESDYRSLVDAAQALPFLAEKRMVIIDNPSANKQLTENIEEFVSSVSDQTDVILVEPKFDKRSQLYKYLKKATDFQELDDMTEQQLITWLVSETKTQGGTISQANARYLIARVGNDQMRLSNEVLKLLSYQPEITKNSIDLLTAQTPQSTIFELLDAAFAGNRSKVLRLYDEQRRQKVEPQAILALLVWQLHILAVVKLAGNKTPSEIASEAKLNPFVVRKSLQLTKHISLEQLKELVKRTLDIDIRLKSQPINADQAVQTLLFTIPTE